MGETHIEAQQTGDRVALVIGVVWLAAAAVWFQSGYRYARTLLRAEGIVVGNCGTNGFLPRVEFTPAGGAPVRSCAGKLEKNPANFRVGQRVEVLYRADDPTDTSINSVDEFWLCPSVMAVLALFVAMTRPTASKNESASPPLQRTWSRATVTSSRQSGDPKRYADAKAKLEALEQAAILLTVQEPEA